MLRRSASGDFQGLAQLLSDGGNNAGGSPITNLANPTNPQDAATLATVLAASNFGARVKAGGALLGAPPGPGVQTFPLLGSFGDFPVVNNRLVVGKGLILASWQGSLNVTSSPGGCLLSTKSTTFFNLQQTTVAATWIQGPASHSAFYKSANDNEEIWVENNSSPGVPQLLTAWLYAVKIILD